MVKEDLQIIFFGGEEGSLIYLLGKDPCSYASVFVFE